MKKTLFFLLCIIAITKGVSAQQTSEFASKEDAVNYIKDVYTNNTFLFINPSTKATVNFFWNDGIISMVIFDQSDTGNGYDYTFITLPLNKLNFGDCKDSEFGVQGVVDTVLCPRERV